MSGLEGPGEKEGVSYSLFFPLFPVDKGLEVSVLFFPLFFLYPIPLSDNCYIFFSRGVQYFLFYSPFVPVLSAFYLDSMERYLRRFFFLYAFIFVRVSVLGYFCVAAVFGLFLFLENVSCFTFRMLTEKLYLFCFFSKIKIYFIIGLWGPLMAIYSFSWYYNFVSFISVKIDVISMFF